MTLYLGIRIIVNFEICFQAYFVRVKLFLIPKTLNKTNKRVNFNILVSNSYALKYDTEIRNRYSGTLHIEEFE